MFLNLGTYDAFKPLSGNHTRNDAPAKALSSILDSPAHKYLTPLHARNALTDHLTKTLISHRPSLHTRVACATFSQELQPRSRT